MISRKRKTKEERQIAFKKKIDSIKILTLVLSVDEALKNAQKTLFEKFKVAKTEHVIIQHLINQIEKARANLDLTDEASVAIDQVQIEKNFEFVSIDLTKKSSSTTTTYCETMSENFQQLKKTIEQKMTKVITERLKNYSNQTRSNDKTIVSKSLSTMNLNAKDLSHETKKTQIARKAQSSEKNHANVEKNLTSTSSST